jgi:oligoendopeptidase F
LLETLRPHLDPFDSDYYELILARTPEATVTIGHRELNVTNPGDYAELLRLEDRQTRESAFRKRLAGFKNQADLFAFALFQKALLANAEAGEHKFGNAAEAAQFDSYLNPETVDAVLKAFQKHASLAIRFQNAEKAYQQKLLQLAHAEPWDLDARPTAIPEPRFVIGDASQNVIEATKVFGPDYQAELTNLHDPRNGRLDIVAGDNRKSGDFTWGAYGPSWVFYMQGYGGYLTDVVTFAHESAHAVHFSLLYKAGVPWYYGDGARYFTEGFAKLNELLILDQLAKTTKTQADRLFYLRELNSKLSSVKFASMYWAAYATSFETEVYRRVKSGAIKEPKDIHEVWAEFGRLWTLDFDSFPDRKYTWAGTHHFFDASRYYSNYLFAWVVAVSVYDRLQEDPAFAEKVVKLMKAGFSEEPAVLLRTYLGIDLADAKGLERIFDIVDRRLAEFERQIQSDPR